MLMRFCLSRSHRISFFVKCKFKLATTQETAPALAKKDILCKRGLGDIQNPPGPVPV